MSSKTFLYDRQRTGSTSLISNEGNKPTIVWKTKIPSYPAYSVETMCVMDGDRNIYVGCHNGSLYSFTDHGEIRFSFSTDKKIFATPYIDDNSCYFASGDGNLYSLDFKGNLNWVLELTNEKYLHPRRNIFKIALKKIKIIKNNTKFSIGTIRNWSSINADSKGNLYANVTGTGLNIVSINGDLLKRIKPKYKYPLAGVSFFENDSFVCPDQKRFIYKFNREFELDWQYDIGNYNIWGNPNIDLESDSILVNSTADRTSQVHCIGSDGKLKWKRRFQSEIRGSLSISKKGMVLVPLLNGKIIALDKNTGSTIFCRKVYNGDRVLWTTPTTDGNGNIFLAVRKGRQIGNITALDSEGREKWKIETGKCLSPPMLDDMGRIYFGDWNGYYYCYQT